MRPENCKNSAAGMLLSCPMSSTVRSEIKYIREEEGNYKDLSREYVVDGNRDFQRQYFHIYRYRLDTMRPAVEAAARKLLGPQVLIRRLNELAAAVEDDEGRRPDVLIIGTLFKSQELKPNILKEFSDGEVFKEPPAGPKYVSESDEIILEDDSQRIRLQGDIDVAKLVTGIVAGFFGYELKGGKFMVKKVCFAQLPLQPERPLMPKDKYVAFISGINSSGSEGVNNLQLVVEWLRGEAGEQQDQEFVANIQRVVIVGNSLSKSTQDKDLLQKAKYLTKDKEAGSVNAVKMFDETLTLLAGSVEVDLMPGAYDPTSQLLPQQPFHPCLFPTAAKFPTLHTVTNPYHFEIYGRLIFGTSGQNIEDILKNSDLTDPLDGLASTLRWNHLAPTCPDTVGCYPFRDRDPFILKSCPHVLFAGNQPVHGNRFYVDEMSEQKVHLMSISEFSETSTISLLNLRTLEITYVSFDNIL